MAEEATHIVCPDCGATNRIAAGKDARDGKCGKCGEALFAGPAHADAALFDKQTTRSDVPVVVDFWADWCGPCHAMAPIFEQVSRELEPNFRFLKVDTEAHPEIAARYGVRGIPNLVVIHKGRVLAQQAGAVDAGRLRAWLKQAAAAVQAA